MVNELNHVFDHVSIPPNDFLINMFVRRKERYQLMFNNNNKKSDTSHADSAAHDIIFIATQRKSQKQLFFV